MKKLDIKRVYKYLIDKKYKWILLMFIAIIFLNFLINVTTGMNIFKNSVNQVFSILNIYIEEQKNIYPLQSVGNDYTVNENRQLVMIFLTVCKIYLNLWVPYMKKIIT